MMIICLDNAKVDDRVNVFRPESNVTASFYL